MPKLLHRWKWPVFAGIGLAVSCMNDYEQFEFIPGPPMLDASATGGTAGSAQGSGGVFGSGPDGSNADSGGTAAGGQGGTSGGGTAGSSQGGTSGAGTAGTTGTGGQSGTAGTCGQFEVLCGTTCVDARTEDNCGGCDNDCGQQGYGSGLQCIDMVCGCSASSQCTIGGPTQSTRCSTLAGRCICGNDQCQPGEVCNSGDCSCNGGPSCSTGEVCCQMTGCQTSCE